MVSNKCFEKYFERHAGPLAVLILSVMSSGCNVAVDVSASGVNSLLGAASVGSSTAQFSSGQSPLLPSQSPLGQAMKRHLENAWVDPEEVDYFMSSLDSSLSGSPSGSGSSVVSGEALLSQSGSNGQINVNGSVVMNNSALSPVLTVQRLEQVILNAFVNQSLRDSNQGLDQGVLLEKLNRAFVELAFDRRLSRADSMTPGQLADFFYHLAKDEISIVASHSLQTDESWSAIAGSIMGVSTEILYHQNISDSEWWNLQSNLCYGGFDAVQRSVSLSRREARDLVYSFPELCFSY